MEKRKWYDLDVETSLLGFGAMRFKTINDEIDEEKALKLIDIAYKNGVNYFDTAMPYTNGKNEKFLGKALKRYPRESFYLATKFSLGCIKTKEEAQNIIDIQLKNLQTDYIDFYLVHALSKERFKTIKEWKVLDTLLEWKKQGKIKHIGFSFHDSYEAFIEILNSFDWEFCQIQLNYMDQEIQQGIKGYYELEKRHIPVVIMEPVKGGKLASFNNDVAQEFLLYSNDSLAKWALRWVGSLKGVKVILSGMNELEQVNDNLETFNNFKPLNEKEHLIVNTVIEKLKKVIKVGCTNCKYCMPCPQGINIPRNFRMYNDYAMYNDKEEAQEVYDMLKENNALATKCVGCKACVDKCPQGIDVPKEFASMFDNMTFLKK